jgi:purine-nucleoside phosphorylase
MIPPGEASGTAPAAHALEERGFAPIAAVITLGSGIRSPWREEHAAVVPATDVPGWPVPAVPGHGTDLALVRVGAENLLVMEGRRHYYEARSYEGVVFPIQVAAALGARLAVLTNSAGSLRPGLGPGDLVLVAGHLLLQSALLDQSGFVPSARTDVYWWEGGATLLETAARSRIAVTEGVLACVSGPTYETAAEVGMLRRLGADVASMSLAPEAVCAARLGMDVIGLSLVTNTAGAVDGEDRGHEAVTAAADRMQPDVDRLLGEALPGLLALPTEGEGGRSRGMDR